MNDVVIKVNDSLNNIESLLKVLSQLSNDANKGLMSLREYFNNPEYLINYEKILISDRKLEAVNIIRERIVGEIASNIEIFKTLNVATNINEYISSAYVVPEVPDYIGNLLSAINDEDALSVASQTMKISYPYETLEKFNQWLEHNKKHIELLTSHNSATIVKTLEQNMNIYQKDMMTANELNTPPTKIEYVNVVNLLENPVNDVNDNDSVESIKKAVDNIIEIGSFLKQMQSKDNTIPYDMIGIYLKDNLKNIDNLIDNIINGSMKIDTVLAIYKINKIGISSMVNMYCTAINKISLLVQMAVEVNNNINTMNSMLIRAASVLD